MEPNKAKKDEELNQLQMADLGTARREAISTFDNSSNLPNVTLEDIEATREANIPGTKAHRMAMKHKAQLAAWSNFHKTVNDTGGLEDLDNLMLGQSHRANRIAAMRSSGAQINREANTGPAPKGNHPFSPLSPGRGGGMAGRGRGRLPSWTHGSMNRLERTASPSPGLSSGPSRLDPALDANNDVPRSGQRSHTPRFYSHKRSISRASGARPMDDFSRKLTSPEVFLASAHNAQASTAGPSRSTRSSSTAVGRQGQMPPFHRLGIKPPTAPVVVRSPIRKAANLALPNTPTSPPRGSRFDKAADNKETTKAAAASTSAIVTRPAESPGPRRPKSTTSPGPSSGVLERRRTKVEELQSDADDSPKSEESNDGKIIKSGIAGLLLDLNVSSEAVKEKDPESTACMGSSLAQLEGIDFSWKGDEENKPGEPPVADKTHSSSEAVKFPMLKVVEEMIENLMRVAKKLKPTDDLSTYSTAPSATAKVSSDIGSTLLPTTPQPAAVTQPRVQDWLNRTASSATPLPPGGQGQADNFKAYRSPAQTPSTDESTRDKSSGAADVFLSPTKSVGSECMPGFESLRVSESAHPRAADSSKSSKRAFNSLADSIHAAPQATGYQAHRPKVIGPQPYMPGGTVGQSRAEATVPPTTMPAHASSGPRSAWTAGRRSSLEQSTSNVPSAAANVNAIGFKPLMHSGTAGRARAESSTSSKPTMPPYAPSGSRPVKTIGPPPPQEQSASKAPPAGPKPRVIGPAPFKAPARK